MTDSNLLMGLFQDVDRTADTLDQLREMGISDPDITILSSLPYTSRMLGRPNISTRLPVISMVSAVVGLAVGVFFTVVTPNLYVIRVGGQPIVPGPPTVLLVYAFTLLFLILGTFLGVVFLNSAPSSISQHYHPSLTDGRIGVLFQCMEEQKDAARAILESQGAEIIREPEGREP